MRNVSRILRRNLIGTIGVLLLLVMVFGSVFAQSLTPHEPGKQQIMKRLLPPSWADGGDPAYLLGTDHLGRDIFSRILHGGRVSLTIGLLSTGLSGVFGIALGLVAGYREGWLGDIVMRLVDIQTAFPFLVIAIAVMAALGNSLPTLVVTLALWTWVPFARITHGNVLSIKQRDFVVAERALGATETRILFRHLLPNVLPPLVVVWTFAIAQVIIAESSLSFLGLGVSPQQPSWGAMLADGKEYLETAWWVAVWPIVAIVVTVLSVNLTGDWLRELFDPKFRR